MQQLIFNAQLSNSKKFIRSISGRLGPFIFRTYADGKLIKAYYKPRRSSTGSQRDNIESLSGLLRRIADELQLTVVSINYDHKQWDSNE